MIQPQTLLNVADNSRAQKLMCIRITGAGNHRYAHIGDIIVVVIKEAVPNMPLERSKIIRVVIVRTRKELKRDNGMIIRYYDNAVVVIDQEGNPKGNEKQEILFLEIWTNGSLTPREALYEASRKLIDLFIPFLHAEEGGIRFEENKNRFTLPSFTFQNGFTNLMKNKKGIPLKCIFIDESELPSKIYNCLKRSNIHTLLDLLSNSQEDLMRIEYFHIEDIKHILDTLQKYFSIHLRKNKFSFLIY